MEDRQMDCPRRLSLAEKDAASCSNSACHFGYLGSRLVVAGESPRRRYCRRHGMYVIGTGSGSGTLTPNASASPTKKPQKKISEFLNSINSSHSVARVALAIRNRQYVAGAVNLERHNSDQTLSTQIGVNRSDEVQAHSRDSPDLALLKRSRSKVVPELRSKRSRQHKYASVSSGLLNIVVRKRRSRLPLAPGTGNMTTEAYGWACQKHPHQYPRAGLLMLRRALDASNRVASR